MASDGLRGKGHLAFQRPLAEHHHFALEGDHL